MSRDVAHDLLLPLSYLYAAVTGARNRLYDRGFLSTHDCGRPVISVGNLTTGGTGKTPFVAWLAAQLKSRGFKLAVISRGYRSPMENQVSRVERSSPINLAAAKWGDEPVMLAENLGDIPVFVGRDKLSVAKRAVAETGCDIILADDAFQHRRLKRTFDIVLLDASEPDWHLRPLPAGRLRESASALQRADVIALTKVNLAAPGARERLREWYDSLGVTKKAVWLEFESRLVGFWKLSTDEAESKTSTSDLVVSAETLGSESTFLVSGLAKPQGFEDLILRETKLKIVGHKAYADHHQFLPEDMREIEQKAQTLGASRVVMTEKDAVKFPRHSPFAIPVWVSRIETRPLTPLDDFHERLTQSLR